jgi:hypothetical protein
MDTRNVFFIPPRSFSGPLLARLPGMSRHPSCKSSFARLFSAAMGLMAAILDLLAGAVRLGAAGVHWTAASLERAAGRTAPRVHPVVSEPSRAVLALARTLPVGPTGPTGTHFMPPAPAAGPAAGPDEDKLRGALMGLGYQTGRVRAFTVSCRGRTEGLDVLVREGIQKLAAN